MKNYRKMVEKNKALSEEKVNLAKAVIQKMLEDNDQVTVGQLVKRTGLSRAFFYKNEMIVKELDAVKKIQKTSGCNNSQRAVFDTAMNKQLAIYKRLIDKLEKRNDELEKENIRLQKALNRKEIEILKNL